MSVQTTLDAIKGIWQAALTGLVPGTTITVLTEAQGFPLPASTPLPVLILTEWHDVMARDFNGMKGNPQEIPNIYSYVFLARPAKQTNTTLPAEIKTLIRPVAEALKAAFLVRANQGLNPADPANPLCVIAGESIKHEFDRDGPYLNYLGQLYVGFRGQITVYENFVFETFS